MLDAWQGTSTHSTGDTKIMSRFKLNSDRTYQCCRVEHNLPMDILFSRYVGALVVTNFGKRYANNWKGDAGGFVEL